MLADADLVAFAAAHDLDAAEAFYGGVLGLALVDSTPFAKVFDAHGTQLRVTRVEASRPRPTPCSGGGSTTSRRRCRAARPRRRVQALRGARAGRGGAWTAPGGSRIAWFADPDGNTLSLQQAP